MCTKNDFDIFVSSDLDLWPLDIEFVPIVTLVQRYVSSKLDVSRGFLFPENRKHRTDATINVSQGGLHINTDSNAWPARRHTTSSAMMIQGCEQLTISRPYIVMEPRPGGPAIEYIQGGPN